MPKPEGKSVLLERLFSASDENILVGIYSTRAVSLYKQKQNRYIKSTEATCQTLWYRENTVLFSK